jgi:NAD(P)-dependent dehydrogenase (short-subunit alcohol dehydrogenase family)
METKSARGLAAMITGGAQGIGKRIVERLRRDGASVAFMDVDEEAGLETLEELRADEASERGGRGGGETSRVLFIRCDVASEDQVREGVERAAGAFGGLNSLVNNAGVFSRKPVTELGLEDWNRVLAANLTGAFLCAKHAAPHLRKNGGSIVNVASTRALMSEKDTEAYSASKGGLVSLTHALAVSLGPEVRVNCISPGWIETSGLRKKSARAQARLSEEDHSQHPAGRAGNADDVAALALFLLDPENSFVTGQNFVVDGGMTRKMIYVE